MRQEAGGQPVHFIADGFSLSGRFHLPPGDPSAVIVGCHGLLSDKNSPKQIELARRCVEAGMGYLRFDHRGCGESEGQFEADTTLENRKKDLLAALDLVRRRFDRPLPVGLFGSSLGGTVCLTALADASPFALVTLAAPVQSRSIRLPENAPFALKREMAESRLLLDIATRPATAHHLLILHGTKDKTVPVDHARRLFALAKEPKRLMLLEGADHRISDARNQERCMRAAVAWLVKHSK